jgi:hypothetical protein|tara:strand:+ start:132 stop:1733 length:1602 start_codon:yes stop_codon:yes gene_type:complete
VSSRFSTGKKRKREASFGGAAVAAAVVATPVVHAVESPVGDACTPPRFASLIEADKALDGDETALLPSSSRAPRGLKELYDLQPRKSSPQVFVNLQYEKQKRTPGPYMNFCKITRPRVVEENPALTLGAVSKELGARWRRLSDHAKAKYRDISPVVSPSTKATRDRENETVRVPNPEPSFKNAVASPVDLILNARFSGRKRAKNSLKGIAALVDVDGTQQTRNDPSASPPNNANESSEQWYVGGTAEKTSADEKPPVNRETDEDEDEDVDELIDPASPLLLDATARNCTDCRKRCKTQAELIVHMWHRHQIVAKDKVEVEGVFTDAAGLRALEGPSDVSKEPSDVSKQQQPGGDGSRWRKARDPVSSLVSVDDKRQKNLASIKTSTAEEEFAAALADFADEHVAPAAKTKNTTAGAAEKENRTHAVVAKTATPTNTAKRAISFEGVAGGVRATAVTPAVTTTPVGLTPGSVSNNAVFFATGVSSFRGKRVKKGRDAAGGAKTKTLIAAPSVGTDKNALGVHPKRSVMSMLGLD